MHACLRHRKYKHLTSNQLDCASWVLNQCYITAWSKWSLCYTLLIPCLSMTCSKTLQLESHPRHRYNFPKTWNKIRKKLGKKKKKKSLKRMKNRMRKDCNIVSSWAAQSPVKGKACPFSQTPLLLCRSTATQLTASRKIVIAVPCR